MTYYQRNGANSAVGMPIWLAILLSPVVIGLYLVVGVIWGIALILVTLFKMMKGATYDVYRDLRREADSGTD